MMGLSKPLTPVSSNAMMVFLGLPSLTSDPLVFWEIQEREGKRERHTHLDGQNPSMDAAK